MSESTDGLNDNAALSLAVEFTGAKALVVDDDPIQRELAGDLLESAGLRVSFASNGQEAVHRVQTQAFAVVLMDIHMPVMDVLEASRLIRTLPGGDLPIIVVTAEPFETTYPSLSESGINDVLRKPYLPEQLQRMVLKHLRSGRQQTHATENPQIPPGESGLPTLDRNQGLARCQGNTAKYKRFLVSLLTDPAYDLTGLRELIRANSAEAIYRCHTTQGVAAMLGALDYHACVSGLEKELLNGRSLQELEARLVSLDSARLALGQFIDTF